MDASSPQPQDHNAQSQGIPPPGTPALPPPHVTPALPPPPPPSGEQAAPAQPTAPAEPTPKRRALWIIPVVVLAAAALLFVIIVSHFNGWRSGGSPYTNDAYLQANIVPMSTQASGTLQHLYVGDFQRVKAGELIAQIDESSTRAQLDEAESALAASEAGLNDNQVQKEVQAQRIAEAQHSIGMSVEEERAAVNKADGADAQARNSSEERSRQDRLYKDAATTLQTLQRTIAEDDASHASLRAALDDTGKAQANIRAQRAVLAQNQQTLRLLDAKDADIRADIRQRLAAVGAAQVQLNYTRIYAPVAGMVTERKAYPGQYLSPGTEVISLVEGNLWVLANYEETQLARMQVGDPADIRIDAIPGAVFHGHVIDLSPASGSATSLIPPDNATGNFTKVTQRIPVRISIEGRDVELGRLRPGFSCEVTVHPSGHR